MGWSGGAVGASSHSSSVAAARRNPATAIARGVGDWLLSNPKIKIDRVLVKRGATARARVWKPLPSPAAQVENVQLWSAHTTATFTQWIGGSESYRQLHSSPPSRPIQSCPVVVPK